MRTQLLFKHALIGTELRPDVRISIDEAGFVEALDTATGPADGDLVLPGLPNAHSHCFQRALAGFGEAAGGNDGFWSWREAMYRLAAHITPADMRIIARQAFAEMVRAGFTSVAEFHYLHHLPDGTQSPEMAQAVIAAAADIGIHLVLLPVYYRTGGFGKPASAAQQRFLHAGPEAYCRLLESLHTVRLGVAPHSLRAVPLAELHDLLAASTTVLGNEFPVHIHISEQVREVSECLEHYGTTPIDLLAGEVGLGPRWNLVHATHATPAEMDKALDADAGVVICPLTEAYLGDGLSAAAGFWQKGGSLAVGSDSNCRIDPVEELRWLEYGQRLRQQQRAQLAAGNGLGIPLWSRTARAGGRALGEPVGEIAVGRRADLVVLSAAAGALAGHEPSTLLDAFVIGGSRSDIADVYIGGRRVVSGGELPFGDTSADFARVVKDLCNR